MICLKETSQSSPGEILYEIIYLTEKLYVELFVYLLVTGTTFTFGISVFLKKNTLDIFTWPEYIDHFLVIFKIKFKVLSVLLL